MAFKQSEESGDAVTADRFKCEQCGQVNNMVKLKANITSTTDQICSEHFNPGPDVVQVKEEYLSSQHDYDFDTQAQPVLLGVKSKVEQIHYRWHFVKCPQCHSKHLLEYYYNSEVGEEFTHFFPLFSAIAS